MIKLDNDLLQELGLAALPEEEKKKLLAHIYETLEMRVGMKLAEQMSDAQLSEFEQFINRSDEAGALKWLETNFPNYKDVVASEFEHLKSEIRQAGPQILSASSQQPVADQNGQSSVAAPSQPPVQQQYPPTPPPQPLNGQTSATPSSFDQPPPQPNV